MTTQMNITGYAREALRMWRKTEYAAPSDQQVEAFARQIGHPDVGTITVADMMKRWGVDVTTRELIFARLNND